MTQRVYRGALATAFGAICAAGVLGTPAEATNGYFANGYDPASKAMAGAGVAVDTGPLGAAVNPALGFQAGNSAGACVSVFSPHSRGFTVGGAAPIAPGTYESVNDVFYVPCIGAHFRLNDQLTLGFTAVGNGGMNTEYTTNPFAGFGSTAPFGVNLEQLFMSVDLAYKVNENVTLGFAPVYAFQRFSATGLEGFAGFSTDGTKLTNNGNDYSRGWGFNLGILIDVTPNLSFGAAYRSKIDMSPFSNYAGLFAEGGDFDIPASATVGGAYTLPNEPRLTLTAEWQRIFYGDVAAIANPENLFGSALGAPDGSGFGWKDMDVFRIGAAWEHNDQLTLRGGVSYATEFTDSTQVLFNTLAPATPQWHVSIGADYRINDNWTVTGSYVHAIDKSLSGNAPAPLGGQPISLHMVQDEVTIGMNYTW